LGFAAGAPLTFRFATGSSSGNRVIHTAVAPVAEHGELAAELVVVLEGCSMRCSGHPTLFENQDHEAIQASFHSVAAAAVAAAVVVVAVAEVTIDGYSVYTVDSGCRHN